MFPHYRLSAKYTITNYKYKYKYKYKNDLKMDSCGLKTVTSTTHKVMLGPALNDLNKEGKKHDEDEVRGFRKEKKKCTQTAAVH